MNCLYCLMDELIYILLTLLLVPREGLGSASCSKLMSITWLGSGLVSCSKSLSITWSGLASCSKLMFISWPCSGSASCSKLMSINWPGTISASCSKSMSISWLVLCTNYIVDEKEGLLGTYKNIVRACSDVIVFMSGWAFQ